MIQLSTIWKLSSKKSMVQCFLNTLVYLPEVFLKCYLKHLLCREPVRACCKKKNFTVDPVSGISVILRTRKAKGCNSKACNLLKRNFVAELFMENIPKFLKQLSNIVWSSNLAALQALDGESATPEFSKSSRVGELLLVTYQYKWMKQSSRGVLRKRWSEKFCKVHSKTLVPESTF